MVGVLLESFILSFVVLYHILINWCYQVCNDNLFSSTSCLLYVFSFLLSYFAQCRLCSTQCHWRSSHRMAPLDMPMCLNSCWKFFLLLYSIHSSFLLILCFYSCSFRCIMLYLRLRSSFQKLVSLVLSNFLVLWVSVIRSDCLSYYVLNLFRWWYCKVFSIFSLSYGVVVILRRILLLIWIISSGSSALVDIDLCEQFRLLFVRVVLFPDNVSCHWVIRIIYHSW